jgi:hypothetical protein
LQQLSRGPATAKELIVAVLETVGSDAYPDSDTARESAFKHDRENLRNRLGADFIYDQRTRQYSLNDPGPFGQIHLSEDGLRGLALLSRDFGNGVGLQASIRALLNEIMPRLSPEARRRLESQPEGISLDLRQDVDQGVIPLRVWESVQRATEKHRKLSFHYVSPRYENGQPVFYEVAPQKLLYQEGHWYLRAWSLSRREAQGDERREPAYLRFRLNYILDDEGLHILPTVLPAPFRRPPRIPVHYLLKPEIGRGEISHHFDEIQITRHPDGSAEVRGSTDDVWEAARILLGYGEGCIVLGGEELVKEMLCRVRGMASNYGLLA